MTGETFINNKDISTYYGARLIETSFDNLKLPAPRKAYVENKSRLDPGKQVFISNPQPDERIVQLTFDIVGTSITDYLTKFDALVAELNIGEVALKVVPLRTIYNLYTESYMSLSTGIGITEGKLLVKLNEPNPTDRTAL